MKKSGLIKVFLLILFVLSLIFLTLKLSVNERKTVTIEKTEFEVEMARTDAEKTRGLAGHKPLKDNEGMLFVFGPSALRQGSERAGSESTSFWMKGMTIPIDIIWIKNNKVFYLVENAQPPYAGMKDSELPVFTPPEGADYVLEVKAGEVKNKQIKAGDRFNF